MAVKKDAENPVEPPTTTETTAQPTELKASTVPVFRDKAYKSRILILDDGRAFAVEKARIEATDPALLAYLEQHPDFSREA